MAGLQFNNTTNRELGLIQDCEDRLNFPPGGISGNSALLAQFTRNMNIWYQKIVTMIFDSQDAWDWDDSNQIDYPIATASMVAGQQDYELPVSLDILKIQRLDVSYDNGTSWRRATPFQVQETSNPLDAVSMATNFTTDNPKYDIRFNSLFIYPIPLTNSANGFKLWFLRPPLEFAVSDTTKTPGIDYPFHSMLSIGAALDYSIGKNLPQQGGLSQIMMDYESRLRKYYGFKDEDRDWEVKSRINDLYGS